MSSAPPSTTLQRVPHVTEGDTDTMLSASRINDLAKAIHAFTNIKGGRNVTSIVQRGFRWKDLKPDSTRTCFSKEVRDELFAAVNGLSRTTGNPPFRFIVADGNVNLVAGTGHGGTPLVEPPKDGEHLLEAHVTNRLIDAVNRAWQATATDNMELVKADAGWLVSGGFCTYDASYDHGAIPQWEVLDGFLDLIGKREPDGVEVENLIPDSGMYWDLAGTTAPENGVLQNINPLRIQAGHQYELGFSMAGNNRDPYGGPGDYVSRVRVGILPEGGTVVGGEELEATFEPTWNDGWLQVIHTFTATTTWDVRINFRQMTRRTPNLGNLVNDVWMRDLTTGLVLISDDFDGRYVCSTGLPWDDQSFIP